MLGVDSQLLGGHLGPSLTAHPGGRPLESAPATPQQHGGCQVQATMAPAGLFGAGGAGQNTEGPLLRLQQRPAQRGQVGGTGPGRDGPPGPQCTHGLRRRETSVSSLAPGLCGPTPPPAGRTRGAALVEARLRKERVYPELLRSNRCRLVFLALEVGGLWSEQAASFIRLLAQSRSRGAAPALRPAVVAALLARWSAAGQSNFGGPCPCRPRLPAKHRQPSASVTASWAGGRRDINGQLCAREELAS